MSGGLKRGLRPFTFGTGKSGGRNSSGRITSWHRGGGAKRLQRTIDLKRNTASSLGVVERIEYDPNRSSRIALVRWLHGIYPPQRNTSPSAAASSPGVLRLDPASAAIRGVFAFNSMLPPSNTTSRNVFLSALSSKAKARGSESKAESPSSLGLPRIAVAASRPEFFAQRGRGEETLQVRNWRKQSDAWTHRNKRKAAISWHSIAR